MYGAPVQEGRVTAVITARMLLGRLGLHRPGLVLICLTVRSSQAHEGDDLTNYGAFGPFVRSFILLVDPGDICPPQYARTESGWDSQILEPNTHHMFLIYIKIVACCREMALPIFLKNRM
jgi:hypothetical protein